MKTTLIIGGTRGIGKAILNRLLDSNQCINFSRALPEFSHSNLQHFSLDVLTDELPDIEVVDSIIYAPGSIRLKPITTLKEADFLEDFSINVLGAVRVINKYYRKLRKSEEASILLFSTVAVAQGMPFHSSIAAAKGGVEGLTRSLAAEFAPKVRVNCIAPSITDTDLAAGILRNDLAREKSAERHPLKTILKPDDIANMACFLVSKEARAITGQVIGVDAGLSTLKV